MDKPLSKTVAGYSPNPIFVYNLNTVGYYDPLNRPFDNSKKYSYHEIVKYCRYFYERDTIARTVINRMVNLAVTRLRNRKEDKDVNNAFYDAISLKLQPFLKHMATEYFVNGMVVPAFTYKTVMMNKLDPSLSRKRVEIPDQFWIRNAANIKLRKRPTSMDRAIYLELPQDEIMFIVNKGKRSDGTDDTAAYRELLKQHPEYVRQCKTDRELFLSMGLTQFTAI